MGFYCSLRHIRLLCVFHLPPCNRRENKKNFIRSSYSTFTVGEVGASPTPRSESSLPSPHISIVGLRNQPSAPHVSSAYPKSTLPPQIFSKPKTTTSALCHPIADVRTPAPNSVTLGKLHHFHRLHSVPSRLCCSRCPKQCTQLSEALV